MELAGYIAKRLFDLIAEVSGDASKAALSSLLLAAFTFPVAAVFYYLHLDPKRWRWVLAGAAVTVVSAYTKRAFKSACNALKSRRSEASRKSSEPTAANEIPIPSNSGYNHVRAQAGKHTESDSENNWQVSSQAITPTSNGNQ